MCQKNEASSDPTPADQLEELETEEIEA